MYEISNVSHLKAVVGEKHISWHTSGRRLAVRSCASLSYDNVSSILACEGIFCAKGGSTYILGRSTGVQL